MPSRHHTRVTDHTGSRTVDCDQGVIGHTVRRPPPSLSVKLVHSAAAPDRGLPVCSLPAAFAERQEQQEEQEEGGLDEARHTLDRMTAAGVLPNEWR